MWGLRFSSAEVVDDILLGYDLRSFREACCLLHLQDWRCRNWLPRLRHPPKYGVKITFRISVHFKQHTFPDLLNLYPVMLCPVWPRSASEIFGISTLLTGVTCNQSLASCAPIYCVNIYECSPNKPAILAVFILAKVSQASSMQMGWD